MTTGIVRAKTMEAPAIVPLSGTLLDAATVTQGIEWMEPSNGALFESYNCIVTDRQADWPCPRTFLAAPVQAAAGTATTGGTVPADTYFITVTTVNAAGESLESNEISRVTTGATSTITVNWGAVTGATGYRIYITGGLSGSEKFLIAVGAVTSYIWTGTPAIGTQDPPIYSTAETFVSKVFEQPDWQSGVRFQVYAGIECKPFGHLGSEAVAAIQKVFESRESYGVERALIETLLQGATDLTPAAGAVDPVVGLAILEGDASTLYAGAPTIHVPRTIGSILMTRQAIHAEGGKFYSGQGSKVASGGGYDASNVSPAAVAHPVGELWLYASGEVAVAQGPIFPKSAHDTTTNVIRSLVERASVMAIDCYKSAVRVKVQ